MQAAQNTFISSTFWTERIGPTAGIATLREMEIERSWHTITEQGKKVQKLWQDIATQKFITIESIVEFLHSQVSALTAQKITYKTYFTQEMLKRSYLASNECYLCTEHTDGVIMRVLPSFQ